MFLITSFAIPMCLQILLLHFPSFVKKRFPDNLNLYCLSFKSTIYSRRFLPFFLLTSLYPKYFISIIILLFRFPSLTWLVIPVNSVLCLHFLRFSLSHASYHIHDVSATMQIIANQNNLPRFSVSNSNDMKDAGAYNGRNVCSMTTKMRA